MTTTFSLRDLGISAGQARSEELTLELPPYVQGAVEFADDTGGGKAKQSKSDARPPGIEYAARGGTTAARLDTTAMTHGLSFRLRFDADYVGPCARCLEPASLHVDVDAHAVHDFDTDDEELRSDHVDEQANVLDVSAWAREEVGVRFPTQVLCRRDCRGLCAQCGTDLNADPEHAHEKPADSRWDALKALKVEGDVDEPDA